MKKLLYVMIAAFGMSFAACGGHATEETTEAAVDTLVETVDTVAVDTVAVEAPVDTVVAE